MLGLRWRSPQKTIFILHPHLDQRSLIGAQGNSRVNSGSLVEGAAGPALRHLMSKSTFGALKALRVEIGGSKHFEASSKP